jgi:hypothetical protein
MASKGTKPPNIVLPFTEGLEYFNVTSVRPTVCSNVCRGLGAGVLICALTARVTINTAA